MSEKQWFEVSGHVDCQFRLVVQAIDEAEAKELFWGAEVDIAEFIDWIDDISVSSITPSEPDPQARVLTVQDAQHCRQTDASFSRPASTRVVDPQKTTEGE